ncbi:hypothetical protein ABZV29_16875 [Streptomyces sp. NPDC005236]|uniref:hypothetical protein n=1 Tax=Streptomyces sp. NPDC005236 TaxID=3157028 RepID=UPI0033AB624A
MPIATNELLSRDTAVQRIARRIAARDAYVITAPPTSLPRLSSALTELKGWHAYLDSGTPAVMRTDRAGALLVADLLMETAGVIVVPKTVPASELGEVVGQELPADGSQDLVVLMPTDGGPIFWPLLFVDALALVDPPVAAHLRAQHIADLN